MGWRYCRSCGDPGYYLDHLGSEEITIKKRGESFLNIAGVITCSDEFQERVT